MEKGSVSKLRHILFLAMVMLVAPAASAETMDYKDALSHVVNANPRLKAESSKLDATKSENLSGLNLPNPEVDFAYQFGNNQAEGDKKVLDVTQGFDFATLSGAKKDNAKALNSQSEIAFHVFKSDITLEADALMSRIVYLRKLKSYYQQQLVTAEKLCDIANKFFDSGTINIVELNRAKMELAYAQNNLKLNDIDLANAEALLSNMAGGSFSWQGTQYMEYLLPSDYETWSKEAAMTNPEAMLAIAAAKSAESELRLRKKEQLPDFSLGYSSEMTPMESFYGFKVGLELPFWGKRGRVKAAKAAKEAADIEADVAKDEFFLKEKALHGRACQLAKYSLEMKKLSKECDITEGLQKLLINGQISINDYILQKQPLVEMQLKELESEYAYQEALVEFRNLR